MPFHITMALLAAIPKRVCQITFILGFFLLFVSARVPAGLDGSRGSILMVQSSSIGESPNLESDVEGHISKHPVSPKSLDPPEEDLYPIEKPYHATILSVEKMGSDYCSVLIEHRGHVPYWEGMCYKVIPPNMSHEDFAYFCLASSRYGDNYDGMTATLSVKRVGKVSNYLCNARSFTPVGIAGPSLTNMLLAQDNPFAPQIMVATETGIAPFRGYLRRMFVEDVPFVFKGHAWLLFGAKDNDSILYDKELTKYANENPTQFKYEKAIPSIEGVRGLVEKNIVEIYNMLNIGGYISFCGLETMMPEIEELFWKEAMKRGENWKLKQVQLIQTNQWRQIVYHFGKEESYIRAI